MIDLDLELVNKLREKLPLLKTAAAMCTKIFEVNRGEKQRDFRPCPSLHS